MLTRAFILIVLEALGTPVPLSDPLMRILRRQFYSPLILLKSLNEACLRGGNREVPDTPPTPHQGEEQDFKTFVNKLAQICDSEPKGATVSAIFVLQKYDGVKYLFASNRRSQSQLEQMKENLLSILELLKMNILSKKQQSTEELSSQLLRCVVSVNHCRIKSYLSALADNIAKCMGACDREAVDSEDHSGGNTNKKR